MTEDPVTNWAEYFSENNIDILSECLISINQYFSGDHFESICYAQNFTSTPPHLF